jgi:hypothetical protein
MLRVAKGESDYLNNQRCSPDVDPVARLMPARLGRIVPADDVSSRRREPIGARLVDTVCPPTEEVRRGTADTMLDSEMA